MKFTPFLGIAVVFLCHSQTIPGEETGTVVAGRNRLSTESSPYLRLHKDNPVHWFAWGTEAFEEAKKRNLPILLSIGYSSCHWCHVMNRESFADPKMAAFLNQHFICIKVDREERPDVDHVYMSAVQAITGDGGWPLTAFLLPDGRPFFGGTYFPPEDRTNDAGELTMPGFARVLKTMKTLYDTKRGDVDKQATNLTEFLRRQSTAPALQRQSLADELLSNAADKIRTSFDTKFGGIAYPPDYAPKFPQPAMGILLATLAGTAPMDESLKLIRQQADFMTAGGIQDQVGGGFHRYSVDRQWIVPHFEKMLYDQAQLLSFYSRIHAAQSNPSDKGVVRGIIEFLTREMMLPNGLFCAALDADSEHVEGKFYVWTANELREALGEDFPWAVEYLGIGPEPNFEEKYILTRSKPIDDLESEKRWATVRARLLATRAKRVRPALDSKAITSWNALLVVGIADAAMEFNDPSYRKLAIATMDALLANSRRADGALFRQVIDGAGKGDGFADDYAATIVALLVIHKQDPKPAYLEIAKGLGERLLSEFWDPIGKGFFYSGKGAESLIVPIKESYDGAVPSANGLGALALVQLASRTADASFADKAREALEALSQNMAENPTSSAVSLLALQQWLKQQQRAIEVTAPSPMGKDMGIVTVNHPEEPLLLKAGTKATFDLMLSIREGWHINANPAKPEYLKPTVIRLAKKQPFRIERVEYPPGMNLDAGGVGEGLSGYTTTATCKITVAATEDVKQGSGYLDLELQFQACDDQRCLAPAVLPIRVPVQIQ